MAVIQAGASGSDTVTPVVVTPSDTHIHYYGTVDHQVIPQQPSPWFAYDTFTIGNTGDAIQSRLEGGLWVNATGGQTAILTSGGRAHGNGAGECDYYNSSPPPSPDQTVTATIFMATAVGYAAVEARCTTNMSSRYEIVFHGDTGIYNLRKVVAGVVTNLGSYQPISGVAPGGTTTVTLIALGSTLMAVVDGVLCMTATDTSITAANFTGFLLESTSGTTDAVGLGIDSFSASDGSLLTLITGSETGTGSDAAAVITVFASDSGTGTEAVSGLFLSGQNGSGTGVEAVSSIALTASETGSGTETALPILLVADTGSGTEAVTGLTLSGVADPGGGTEAVSGITLTGLNQAGSGAEDVASIALAASDTGSATESALPILLTADTASSAETVTGIALSQSDAATGNEAILGIAVNQADTASGVEAVGGIALNQSDTGSGAEGAGITLSGVGESGTGTQAVSGLALSGVNDAATGTEESPQIALAASDSGTAAESAQVVGQGPTIITASETGTGTEATSGISLSATESGVTSESVLSIALTASEAGIAADQVARLTLVSGDMGAVIDGVLVISLGAADVATVVEHATVTPVVATVVPTLFTTTAIVQHVYAVSAIAGGASESLVLSGHGDQATLVDDHALTAGDVRGVDYALVESTTTDGS